MTTFEIAVPLIAVSFGVVCACLARASAKRLDRDARSNPAE